MYYDHLRIGFDVIYGQSISIRFDVKYERSLQICFDICTVKEITSFIANQMWQQKAKFDWNSNKLNNTFFGETKSRICDFSKGIV